MTVDSVEKLSAALRETRQTLIKTDGIPLVEIQSVAANLPQVKKVGLFMKKSDLRQNETRILAYREILDQNAKDALLEKSFSHSVSGGMRFVSDTEGNDLRTTVIEAGRTGRLFLMTEQGKEAGLLLIRDFAFEGEATTLISWAWRSPEVRGVRSEFIATIEQILRTSAREKILAAIHLKNQNSLKVASEIGMVPICLFLSPQE